MMASVKEGKEVVIDGSMGEGGGQVVRTSVALSAVTGKAVRIKNIRAGRSRPGLMAQHLTAIRAVGQLCDAEVAGDKVGSSEVMFSPSCVRPGRIDVEVGTAGSVSLVLQSCILALARTDGESLLIIKGGTDVKMAPPLSYYDLVLFPLLKMMGIDAVIEEFKRGFYPEGGGMCQVRVGPKGIVGLDLDVRGGFKGTKGVAYSQNLPEHVVSRMASTAKRELVDHQPVTILQERSYGPSTGAGVVLSAIYERTVIGSSCLGEKGMSSERVAQMASEELRTYLRSICTLDVHASDQLLPYMALADSPSVFIVDRVTSHLETQIELVRKFLDMDVSIEGQGPFKIRITPIRT